MNKTEIREVKEEINTILKEEKEEFLYILYYSLNSYFNSLLNFGINDEITKDTLNVIKEFYLIIKKEKQLLNNLKKDLYNYNYFDIIDYLNELDNIDCQTIMYYYKVLDDIDTAIEINDKIKAKRIKKDFKTLIERNEYLI